MIKSTKAYVICIHVHIKKHKILFYIRVQHFSARTTTTCMKINSFGIIKKNVKKCFVPFLYLPISASDPNLTLLSSLPLPLLFIHLLEWM